MNKNIYSHLLDAANSRKQRFDWEQSGGKPSSRFGQNRSYDFKHHPSPVFPQLPDIVTTFIDILSATNGVLTSIASLPTQLEIFASTISSAAFDRALREVIIKLLVNDIYL